MSHSAEKIEDSFDRLHIKQIQARFGEINRQRRERMRAALTARQQVLLDLLPLLYHVNHPMLPGYVSNNTPFGVSQYSISKHEFALSKTLSRSFKPKKNAVQEDIHGIYVMGSVGTVAQSGGSDLDAWICHRPDLSRQQQQELQRKCKRVSEWASSLRLDVHFFLMDADAFKQGSRDTLDKESSGSAQKTLLLDEFYRSAIYLAGRTPLWWLIPSHQEHDYQQHSQTLLHRRFVRPDSVLDFGGTAQISAGEFIGAGFWQLYKAIGSPYKSVLKLLLLEAYVSEYPKIEPLSQGFKQAVYDGTAKIDQLDSYMMIYQKIETYLLDQGQTDRLELARRCFYFKVNKPLSKPYRGREKSWQRQLLEQLTARWGWNQEYIEGLDQRSHWKASHVTQERNSLVDELNRSYAVLQQFGNAAGVQREIASEELSVLGRKLRAAYELGPGKIEWINPGISEHIEEDKIIVSQSDTRNGWEVCFGDEARTSLDTDNGIVDILFWCYFNHIINEDTKLELHTDTGLGLSDIRKLLNTYELWLPKPFTAADHDSFRCAAKTTDMLMLVNAPSPIADALDLYQLGDNADALAYGPHSSNLVSTIDLLYRNSWGEVHSRHYTGMDAVINAIGDILELCPPLAGASLPNLQIRCIRGNHDKTIEQRITQLIDGIKQTYYGVRQIPAARLIFKLGKRYVKLQFVSAKASLDAYANVKQLMTGLRDPQPRFSPLLLEASTLTSYPIHAIAPLTHSRAIRVFFRPTDTGMELHIKDEFGTLICTMWQGEGSNPLKSLHRFLRAVSARQLQNKDNEPALFGVYPIEFYELRNDKRQGFYATRRPISPEIKNSGLFDVTATAHFDQDNNMTYDFYCEDQHFSAESLGDQLEQVVAQYIIGRRNSNRTYPISLTDLDLSQCAHSIAPDGMLGIMHYLQIKRVIEIKLNRAIGIELGPR